ncbi:hypothetical protein Tco_0722175 [Tanacetum coccineum]
MLSRMLSRRLEVDQESKMAFCKSKEFTIVRYSIGTDEEFITLSPGKYNASGKTHGNVSSIYHDLFNKKFCGWMQYGVSLGLGYGVLTTCTDLAVKKSTIWYTLKKTCVELILEVGLKFLLLHLWGKEDGIEDLIHILNKINQVGGDPLFIGAEKQLVLENDGPGYEENVDVPSILVGEMRRQHEKVGWRWFCGSLIIREVPEADKVGKDERFLKIGNVIDVVDRKVDISFALSVMYHMILSETKVDDWNLKVCLGFVVDNVEEQKWDVK